MMKRIVAIMMVMVLISSIPAIGSNEKAEAATKYITVGSFAQALADELGIMYMEGSAGSAVEGLKMVGISKEGSFSNLEENLTRGDMLILLSRADDYVNKETVEQWRVITVIEKRISDIKDVSDSKREDIAKGYLKGFMKGSGNGYYITNRNLKLKNKVSKDGALDAIKMIKNASLRAKISPDGQLIRTTNLPKNAKSYEYILASYPNKFYEKKFEFMFKDQYKEGKRNPRNEIFPVDMRNSTFYVWGDSWDFSIEMDKYLYDWKKKAETYLQYLFNVDYRTVDDNWIDGLASCIVKTNIDEAESIRTYYLDYMKANKVIIESSIIAVEPSSLYLDRDYCMRAYIKYRISAKDLNVKHSKLLYAQYPLLENLKSGEWREGVFDIRFWTNDGYQGDGSYFAISTSSYFVDELNVPVE